MKKILLPLLLLFCVSDIMVQPEAFGIYMPGPLALNTNDMCKPTGIETISYPDGKAESAPGEKKTITEKNSRKKETVATVRKKKAIKKNQQKKA